MKCIYHNDLLFREVQVSSEIEELDSEEVIDMDMDLDEVLQEADGFSWDSIVDNDDDGDTDVTLDE